MDKIGNQLKFLSQKQDVVLIKNLLLSVQSRWEKVVQRSVDRGRSLDDARKRAKQVCIVFVFYCIEKKYKCIIFMYVILLHEPCFEYTV